MPNTAVHGPAATLAIGICNEQGRKNDWIPILMDEARQVHLLLLPQQERTGERVRTLSPSTSRLWSGFPGMRRRLV